MRILVTGSAGTIGTRLCEMLLKRGFDVIGADWRENAWCPEVEAITRKMDLRDEHALDILQTENIDVIVHLAANARVYELVQHPDRARDNFLTVFNALEFARRSGVKRFLFSSSRECYGNIRAERFTEDLARIEECESPYTASKIGGEALVSSYRRCYGIDHVTYRFSNVYGMYDDSERVVPNFIRCAKANTPLTVYGKQKCLDFTYIDDAVAAIMLGIERFEEAKNDVYNIAFGEGVTILHLAERVKELMNSASPILVSESRTGEIVRYIADISKAKKVLGYAPKTPFEIGIEKSVQWYTKGHLPS